MVSMVSIVAYDRSTILCKCKLEMEEQGKKVQ